MNAEAIRKKIKDSGLTMAEFAHSIGVDRSSAFRKLNGSTEFTVGEAQKAKEALKLTESEAASFFLA